ncbi:MAG: patatin-like phospholipase family protein [Bacteroidetes bacterium]|nr:patatin-like phospholipase family protein [Bacteroidota bacterium]
MENKPFKILSIDGGGIRGVFPAMVLANYEAELKAKGVEKWQVYQNFDLICGTSTGGIMAVALALGIPAKEIYELYLNNADKIFGSKKGFLKRIKYSAHQRDELETLIRNKYKSYHNGEDGEDPRLKHCKTHVAIPIYDLMEGRPSVLKSKYHDAFVRDYHIPAYQAALATSAAPTYFDPYSDKYIDLNGLEKPFQNKVDGGVFANNPTLNGIIEAQKAFNLQLKDISVLSIGTGHQRFCDAGIDKKKNHRVKYGIRYWMLEDGKKRLIDLFMQGQTQQVQNLISILKNGIDKREPDNFEYIRIDTQLDESCNIEMDETDKKKLEKLAEKANIEFQNNATQIINLFGDGNRYLESK